MKRRFLAVILCLVLALSLLPAAALAGSEGETPTAAAQITTGEGESAVTTTYETLDAAIEAAADGDTIELLADCSIEQFSVTDGRTVTVLGTDGQTVSISQYLNITGASTVVFKGCTVNISGQNPYIVFLNGGSVLTLDDADMTMDGMQEDDSCYDAHAIWFESADTLNVINGANLVVKNYKQDAMEWDGTSPTLNVLAGEDEEGNLIASSVLLTNCRSGIAGTFNITIEGSDFDVLSNTGNGSNGSNYTITDSTVNFRENGSHGLSAGKLYITNSTVNAVDNTYNGIVARDITIDADSHVLVEGNAKSVVVGAFRVMGSTGKCTIDEGADVKIINNYRSGIQVDNANGVMTMNAGVVTGNGIGGDNEYGGGICNKGTFTMSEDVLVYNNAASKAGDDIYVYENGSIAFTDAQSDDGLTLTVRCEQRHTIDGWYLDGADARWNADSKPVYAVKYDVTEDAAAGELAIKAAHGLKAVAPTDPSALSKSKEATNLKKSGSVYTSDVTLSLPSAQEELAADVVLVMDVSMCTKDTLPAAAQLLNELSEAQEQTGAAIKTGIVMFKGNAIPFQPLTELTAEENQAMQELFTSLIEKDGDATSTKDNVKAYLKGKTFTDANGKEYKCMTSGTNLPSGLLLANEMLAADDTVDNARKYVIVVSDGSTYLFTHDGDYTTAYSRTYGAGDYKGGLYETNLRSSSVKPPQSSNLADWQAWLYTDENSVANRDKNGEFSQYDFLVETAGVLPEGYTAIPKGTAEPVVNVDTSLYQVAEVYQQMLEKYHCYYCSFLDPTEGAVSEGSNLLQAMTTQAGLIDGNAGGSDIFSGITKNIFYLVGAGSKVVDVIGHGTDNKGNTYNFDLVNDGDSIQLMVAGEALDKTDLTDDELYANCTAAYGFGKQETESGTFYRFVLRYYENGAAAAELGCGEDVERECFVLDINEAITTDAPVQLTYTVQLTDPQSSSGSYGVYDQYGKNGESGLYTNESATIYPVDSNQEAGMPEDFSKPTVSYRISGGGGGGGETVRKVTLHYVSNGGTTYKDESYDAGTTVELNKTPLRENYTFTGWYADEALTQSITSITLPTNKTVYAGWTQSSVPTSLNSDDHIAYVIGYPQDYRTGEPTEDESLWPVQPNGSITRAEVATIFFRLLKDDVRDGNLTKDNAFTDVQDGKWFNQPISTMAKLGIVKGRTADTFAPNAPITRAEFASICARFDTGTTSVADKFSDVKGHWAETEIARAASLGWILGYEDGTFRPDQPITRAEAMTMINRVLKRIPETESDLLTGMNVWPDNQPGTWYYLAVQEATNSHDHASKGDLYEHWTKITAAPDWSRYEK